MNQDQLRSLFEQVRGGEVDIDEAVASMRHMPFEDLGFAKVDHHRALRHGIPEVIFAKGKTLGAGGGHRRKLLENAPNVLITRADRGLRRAVAAKLPAANTCRSPASSASGATAPSPAKAGSPWSAPAPAICRWPRRRRSPPK